jgi:hypothetical protein
MSIDRPWHVVDAGQAGEKIPGYIYKKFKFLFIVDETGTPRRLLGVLDGE